MQATLMNYMCSVLASRHELSITVRAFPGVRCNGGRDAHTLEVEPGLTSIAHNHVLME